MSNGKKTGSQFERDIARFLTVWLTGKDKPYCFWRTPASGGLATIDELNAGLSGDIRALVPEAEILTSVFSIELKTGYPKTSFWQHFKDIKNFPIEQFWEQCVRDATKANKRPMLIYRKKGNQPIVGVSDITGMLGLNVLGLLEMQSISLTFTDIKTLPRLTFYNMNEFFKVLTPEVLKEWQK
jgi:hypothetical protein